MTTEDHFMHDLKNVVERHVDAFRGYDLASSCVLNPQWSEMLANRSKQRKDFARALEMKARVLDDDFLELLENDTYKEPDINEWINVRSVLRDTGDESIIGECVKEEQETLREYDILVRKRYLGGPLKDLLIEQRNQIRVSLHELEQVTQKIPLSA